MGLSPYVRQADPTAPSATQDWQRQIRNRDTSILKKSVAGSVDVPLTTDETSNNILIFSGVLGANINVIVSSITKAWIVTNSTSGAFTLTVKTASGAGVTVGQGKTAHLYGDGTNVIRATADV